MTSRRQKVKKRLEQGQTYAEIATALNLSESKVKRLSQSIHHEIEAQERQRKKRQERDEMLRQRCPEMAADNTPLDERVIFCIGEGASNAQSEEILGVELAHIRKLRKQLQRAQKRTPLKERLDERRRFRGTFVRYGSKPAFRGPDQRTILLESVADVETGEIVADHLWFNLTKGFAALGTLIEGDVVGFDARVKSYLKGYRGYREDVYKPVEQDYKLSHPTKIEKVRTTDG